MVHFGDVVGYMKKFLDDKVLFARLAWQNAKWALDR